MSTCHLLLPLVRSSRRCFHLNVRQAAGYTVEAGDLDLASESILVERTFGATPFPRRLPFLPVGRGRRERLRRPAQRARLAQVRAFPRRLAWPTSFPAGGRRHVVWRVGTWVLPGPTQWLPHLWFLQLLGRRQRVFPRPSPFADFVLLRSTGSSSPDQVEHLNWRLSPGFLIQGAFGPAPSPLHLLAFTCGQPRCESTGWC